MIIAGGTAAAAVSIVTAWNLLFVPYLNSDLSPVIGAQRYASDQKQRDKTTELLDQTAKTLAKTNESLEALSKRQDRQECADWNRRLRIYTEAVRANPRDQFAPVLRRQAIDAIGGLPGCMQESQ